MSRRYAPVENALMHDRSRRLLGGDGADGGGDSEPVSPTDLHQQADAYPADFEGTPPDAGSIEVGRRRIGKENAPLNDDFRLLGDHHAVERVHSPDEQDGERREMTQVHAFDVVHDITEPIERDCANR